MHLVEVGLPWPPDSFLCLKLTGLAERGVRVTVVSASPRGRTFALPDVELVRLPDRAAGFWRIALDAARSCLRLSISCPQRLVALVVALATPSLRSPARRAVRWRSPLRKLWEELALLRALAIMVPLQPDVVHFEWESAAITYLPLVRVWRCPMVVSCRGGLDVYAHTPRHAAMVAAVPGAFRRAAAVHCVSEATRAEAIRHGLDTARAHVIRSGVDLGAFAPRRDDRNSA